jgi:glycosyltransferase involved in cell wall biosynthesis
MFSPGHSSLRARFGWTGDHVVFGFVGRLTHIKGVDLLAAAFRELAKSVDTARLIIIGRGADEHGVMSVLERELAGGIAHIEPSVAHDALPDWYRAMDAVVMPSRYENFSNVLLEAMACGVTFIASDIGGNRLLAKTGAGSLFTPGSLPALESALKGAVGDPERLRAQGAAARDVVRNRYSWAASAERLEAIIGAHVGGVS